MSASVCVSGGIHYPDKNNGGDDGHDEAEDVELEDVAGPQGVRGDTSDHRPSEAKQKCREQAESLPPGPNQASKGADDESGDDESNHAAPP